jgi:hypothetical protein
MEKHVRSEVSANREADVENANDEGKVNTATVEERIDGPTREDMEEAARSGDPIDREFPAENQPGTIQNAASDPNSDLRRSSGSPNDPHGGHQHLGAERRAPGPNPIEEMVPGGQGAEPPPYTADDIEKRMAAASRQSHLRPRDTDRPVLGAGNPLIGANPAQLAPAINPTSDFARQREGMYETGGSGISDSDPSIRSDNFRQPTETLAYTASQTPNLPPRDLGDPDFPGHVQGSGRLEEPVERRQNSLVFDADKGNFEIKEEMHETGVSSQNAPTHT